MILSVRCRKIVLTNSMACGVVVVVRTDLSQIEIVSSCIEGRRFRSAERPVYGTESALHNRIRGSSTKSFSEKLGRFLLAASLFVSGLAAVTSQIHLRTGASVVLWRHAT